MLDAEQPFFYLLGTVFYGVKANFLVLISAEETLNHVCSRPTLWKQTENRRRHAVVD